ncbi:unnamed protein product [Ambrosiozyma monospora]|uniref:Unnamed protein product n=1 Tax=Ambrosiozyma monospora TaxID=43982 RepID=A0ACB5T7R7_AMBMO|nr:unnamed protein product [Ambrosiozyma monospora]
MLSSSIGYVSCNSIEAVRFIVPLLLTSILHQECMAHGHLIHRDNRLKQQKAVYQSNFILQKSKFYDIELTVGHWQLKDLICKSTTSNSVYFPTNNSLNSISFNQPSKSENEQFHQEESNSDHYTSKHNIRDNITDTTNSHNDNAHENETSNNNMQGQKELKLNYVTTTVAKFHSCPRCIKELDDVIVVGSLANTTRNPAAKNSRIAQVLSNSNTDRYEKTMKGLFGVCVRDTGYTEDVNVGSLINNSVNIFKQSNSLFQSYVCNNDHNLYLMDIVNRSGVELNSIHEMEFALNYSAMSPDNKTLVVVGDNSKFYMVHPEEDFDKNKEFIQTNLDSGISIDFNKSGFLFSVCFQAGVNQIYDIRNTSKPIHKIYSTRKNNPRGAFRVSKFTKNTDDHDLLLTSEHQSRVHMVEARDFIKHEKYSQSIEQDIPDSKADKWQVNQELKLVI